MSLPLCTSAIPGRHLDCVGVATHESLPPFRCPSQRLQAWQWLQAPGPVSGPQHSPPSRVGCVLPLCCSNSLLTNDRLGRVARQASPCLNDSYPLLTVTHQELPCPKLPACCRISLPSGSRASLVSALPSRSRAARDHDTRSPWLPMISRAASLGNRGSQPAPPRATPAWNLLGQGSPVSRRCGYSRSSRRGSQYACVGMMT